MQDGGAASISSGEAFAQVKVFHYRIIEAISDIVVVRTVDKLSYDVAVLSLNLVIVLGAVGQRRVGWPDCETTPMFSRQDGKSRPQRCDRVHPLRRVELSWSEGAWFTSLASWAAVADARRHHIPIAGATRWIAIDCIRAHVEVLRNTTTV